MYFPSGIGSLESPQPSNRAKRRGATATTVLPPPRNAKAQTCSPACSGSYSPPWKSVGYFFLSSRPLRITKSFACPSDRLFPPLARSFFRSV